MRFKETPQYQRMVQKIYRMSPHQRAILSTAVADKAFAGSEMANKLKLMEIGANRQYLEERMTLEKQGLKQRYDLTKKRLGAEKEERRLGEAISAGDVITSGFLGKARMDMDVALAKRLDEMTTEKKAETLLWKKRISPFAGRWRE